MRFFRRFFPLIIVISYLLTFPLSLVAAEGDEYTIISKEGASNIALVLDQLDGQKRGDLGVAQSLDAIITAGLEFPGLFTLIPPPLHAKDGNVREHLVINFPVLRDVAAQLYATGVVTKTGTTVNLAMEVYDIAGAKSLFSKTYHGNEQQLRMIGHAFCADLVEQFTGKRSVFGSKIVFVSTKTGSKEIYQCDFDGQGVEQLTALHSITLTPAYSPDGKFLAYTDFSSGRPRLSIRNLAAKTTVSVASSGISIDPAWRNNRELATTLSLEGDQEIYLIKANGVVARRLTKSDGIDLSPTFSPDGSQMAYVSDRNGQPQIFIQNLDSGQTRRLTFSGAYNTQPSWSPVGDKIAFTMSGNGGQMNICIINTDGSCLMQLTENSGNNESPAFSPDGGMIVFSSSRKGQKKLYTMSATGQNQRPLLRMDGEQTQPFWSLFRK